MKGTLAVVLRAPLALAVLLIVGALLGVMAAVPTTGLAAAFKPAILATGMIDAFPWAVSLSAWYLSIVSTRFFRSRLASHALVFSICAAFMFAGLHLVPLVERPVLSFTPPSPVPRRFHETGEVSVSIEAWREGEALGLLVIKRRDAPRIAWFPEAAWSPEKGMVFAGGNAYRAVPESAPSPDRREPPLVREGGRPSAWMYTTGGPVSLLILALSFAALASGVRFPVRMFAWTMPGATLGLLFAWSVPGLYGVLGSASISEALALAGISLAPQSCAATLAALSGILLFGADLAFRPADEPRRRVDA